MTSLLYIGNKLSHHGMSVSVIEILGKQLEEVGFKVWYAGTARNQYLRLLQMIFMTFYKGRKVNFILIDTYSTKSFWYAFITGLSARIMKIKYIPILHGGDFPVRLKKSRWACNVLFNNAHKNIAVSGYLNTHFKNAGYSSIIIPNNIDINNYPFKARHCFSPKLLWVRAFHKQYNPMMAVEVLINLLTEFPDTVLCMVGTENDGSLEEVRRYAKSKNILSRLELPGWLTQREWIEKSKGYDFFINTTYVDNTPLSVIEAMALGLPVISTNMGGIPYLLENNVDACLVEPNDAHSMAKTIKYLIHNPSFTHHLTLNARRKSERFACSNVMPLWQNLLK